MQTTQSGQKPETMKIEVYGKPATLIFAREPNKEAADFIKRTLISSYLIKAV